MKLLNDSETVREQLLKLSKELYENAQRNQGYCTKDPQEIAFKINSCLYGKYPV